MNKISKEVKIAIVAIIAIALLFFGLNFLKGIIVLSDDNSYDIQFEQIEGLSASSPVYADGYKIGVVRSIDFDYSGQRKNIVHIDLDKELRLPKGTMAEVDKDLMGNVQVNLLLTNNMRERIEPGGIIMGVKATGLMDQAAEMVPVVKAMLPKLDSILVSVNTLLADPAIANSLHNVEAITSDLKVSSAEMKKLMAQLNGQVPGMMAKANGVLANTEQLTGNLAKVDIEGTMAKVNQTLNNVQEFTAQLNSNEGTLGKFMRDPSLYNNMSTLMQSTDSLMTDLKAHPKRYVHFSIFGKKDK